MNIEEYILNVNIISTNSILENHAVILKGDRIKEILPMSQFNVAGIDQSGKNIHNGEGAYLSPGFIDLHSDNIESIVQPRPSSVMDFEMALMEHEKQLVNQGITTMYHSLSFIRKDGSMRDKEARNPDKMKQLVELIRSRSDGNHLIRHKYHCRFDIRNCEGYDILMEYIDKDYIHLLSFNDHTPGQGQYRDLTIYRENLRNHQPELGDSELDRILEQRMAIPKISQDMIERTAHGARRKGIVIASHDDDSEEKIDYVHSELHANISEFPVELNVARKAKEMGMLTVAGAPNVLLGKSHTGNLSAIEAILDGSIDILCSDYFPPSMLHAVFKLHLQYTMPLWQCMHLVALNPAKAVGIDNDYGSIEVGKKGDLLLIKGMSGKPLITKVFIDGQLVSQLNYRGVNYA